MHWSCKDFFLPFFFGPMARQHSDSASVETEDVERFPFSATTQAETPVGDVAVRADDTLLALAETTGLCRPWTNPAVRAWIVPDKSVEGLGRITENNGAGQTSGWRGDARGPMVVSFGVARLTVQLPVRQGVAGGFIGRSFGEGNWKRT